MWADWTSPLYMLAGTGTGARGLSKTVGSWGGLLWLGCSSPLCTWRPTGHGGQGWAAPQHPLICRGRGQKKFINCLKDVPQRLFLGFKPPDPWTLPSALDTGPRLLPASSVTKEFGFHSTHRPNDPTNLNISHKHWFPYFIFVSRFHYHWHILCFLAWFPVLSIFYKRVQI